MNQNTITDFINLAPISIIQKEEEERPPCGVKKYFFGPNLAENWWVASTPEMIN